MDNRPHLQDQAAICEACFAHHEQRRFRWIQGTASESGDLFERTRRLTQDTVKRIFEIFDREERDLLNFTNFLRGLSIFNFAPEETMLAIMFMIYDQPLEKTLKRSELVELYNDNKRFLLDS